jgi:hypothetical protein
MPPLFLTNDLKCIFVDLEVQMAHERGEKRQKQGGFEPKCGLNYVGLF